MPFLQRLRGHAETRHADDGAFQAPNEVSSEGNEELSDADLEEVLGGLERAHFPGDIELPELET